MDLVPKRCILVCLDVYSPRQRDPIQGDLGVTHVDTLLDTDGKDHSHPVGALRFNISRWGVTRFTSKPRFSGY